MSAPVWTRVIDERVAAGRAPGIVACVDRGGARHIHAAGWRDLASGVAMDARTLFRIASVSKPITAAAALLLVDEGRLGLDEPVDRWLPELAGRRVLRAIDAPLDDTVPAREPVTLRGLLAMNFGLGVDFGFRSAVSGALGALGIGTSGFAASPDEYLRRLGSLPLIAQPGERWLYHIGIDIAGILVARIAGTGFGAFLRERLFVPLGMEDTGFCIEAAGAARLASLYADAGGGRFIPVPGDAPTTPPPFEHGGSGLISTASDLARFGRMLLDGGVFQGRRILSEAAVAEMRRDQIGARAKAASPVFPGFWESHGWGLGLCTVTAANPVSPRPGRFGWWGGTGTALFMDRAADAVMVLLSQRVIDDISDSANADALIHAVLAEAG